MKVPLFDPIRAHAAFAEELEAAALRVIRSGRYVLGSEVAAFEAEISERLDGRPVIGVSSGTDAVLIALDAMGIGAGDEVITTPYSFVASVDPILRLGARPVFADIRPSDWNLDPARVAEAVSPRTRAAVVVHLFGKTADVPAIRASLPGDAFVVEDAAQAFGAHRGARAAGTLGEVAAFSFFPTKNLGGYGDGGAVCCAEEAVAAIVRRKRVHGRGSRPYLSEEVGYNARLDALQAALLRVKLPGLDRGNAERRAIAARYVELAAGTPALRDRGLRFSDPARDPGHVFHQYVIEVPAAHRDPLRAHLAEAGVASAVYYPVPLHLQPALGSQGRPEGSFPVAEGASTTTLALPVFPGLTAAEQEHVVRVMRGYFERATGSP